MGFPPVFNCYQQNKLKIKSTEWVTLGESF